MAKAMKRNPKNEIAGPTTIRRVLNMSGLKPFSMLLPSPPIRMNPTTIIVRHIAIRMKFIFPNGRMFFCCSVSDNFLLFSMFFMLYIGWKIIFMTSVIVTDVNGISRRSLF